MNKENLELISDVISFISEMKRSLLSPVDPNYAKVMLPNLFNMKRLVYDFQLKLKESDNVIIKNSFYNLMSDLFFLENQFKLVIKQSKKEEIEDIKVERIKVDVVTNNGNVIDFFSRKKKGS